MAKKNPSASFDSNSQSDLIGRVVPARIKKMFFDSCDLDLLDDKDGPVIAQGRLFQAESLAWQDDKLLKDISGYRVNDALDAVYVRGLRYEEGQALWYVNERWGGKDPWLDLILEEDDIVTGTVTRAIVSPDSGRHVGYLVQLDVGRPIRVSSAGIVEPCDPEREQPDIEVFLPDEELPWTDGSLDAAPESAKTTRLSLVVGDPVQALVREIRFPPRHPMVSVARLIHRRDAIAEKAFNHRNNMARWRFLRFLGKTKSTNASEKDKAPEFGSGDGLYAGRRFLLIDDNVATLEAQSELLSLMGAETQTVPVRPGGFGAAVDQVITALKGDDFDMVLVDNNLPGKDLGQTLINRVCERLITRYPLRFILITTDGGEIPTGQIRKKLRAKCVLGFVHRPLRHDILQRILAGEELWEEARFHAGAHGSTQHLPSANVSPTPGQILDTIARQPDIHFAVLIRATRQIEAHDMIVAGNVPFGWDNVTDVLGKTALPLLIDKRIPALDILTQEGGNELLCVGHDGRSHWRTLELSNTPWIFGVGYAPDRDILPQLPLWSAALGAAMDAQGWREWGRHVSNFVQLGLAHQGLSHEVIHLQSEFSDLLFMLGNRVGKLKPGMELKKQDSKYLSDKISALGKSNARLLAFSKHQLYGQALRDREVFLPDAIDAIRRIADPECQEAEVALHIVDPPPLALPLPNATLVLSIINLLLNAAKHHYRQENRRVELSFDLEEKDGGQFLLIDVRDNGPGLTQPVLERLWQPGFSSAADHEKRHGIGLWLSRQLVEEAHGTLALHQHWRGLGACFRLRFPIHLG